VVCVCVCVCVVTNLDTSQWKHEAATVNGLINHYRIFLFYNRYGGSRFR